MWQFPLGVQSYAEAFLIMLAWVQYDALWTIIVQTGLVYLPFISIILKNFADSYQSPFVETSTQALQNRIEYGFIAAIITIMLAAQPMVTIKAEQVLYTPHCSMGNPVSHGNTGTTYDDTFPFIAEATVPPWWYAVLAISQAITSSSIQSIKCLPDLRQLGHDLELTQIDDPLLREELELFNSSCFGRARAKFYREQPDIDDTYRKFGKNDTDWMGSSIYRHLPGYYDTMLSPKPIKGFSFERNRNWEDDQTDNKPKYGRPTCKAWWEEKDSGLSDRLFYELSNPVQQFLNFNRDTFVYTAVIKKLVKQVSLKQQSNVIMDWWTSIGVRKEQAFFWPKTYMLVNALDILQATIIFLVILLLPWVMLFTAYQPGTLVKVAFILFSLKYFSFLWEAVKYLDAVLLRAIYPNEGLALFKSAEFGVAEMLIATMYVALPTLWLFIMSWVGVRAGNGLQSLINSSAQPAESAGASTTGVTQTVATFSAGHGHRQYMAAKAAKDTATNQRYERILRSAPPTNDSK